MTIEDTFTRIYETNHWACSETVSGIGSTMAWTANVRERLPWLLKALGVRDLLDAGCGDFHWMRYVDLEGVRYLGCDVVPDLIEKLDDDHGDEHREFFVADLTSTVLPKVDLIFCRTVLFHLSHEHALQALANFRAGGSAWLLATTYPYHFPNEDVADGGWRPVNLQAAPYCLPTPWLLVPEDAVQPGQPLDAGYLGLWRI